MSSRKTNLATSPPTLPAMKPTKKPRKARVSRRVAPKKKPAAEPPASVAAFPPAVVEPVVVVESKSPKPSTRSLKTSESPAAGGTPKHAWAISKWVRFRTFVTQLSRHKKLSPFAQHLSAVSSMNIFLAALSCNPDFQEAIAAANKGDREARDAAVENGLQRTALANGVVTSDFPAGDYVKLQRFMALWVSMDSY